MPQLPAVPPAIRNDATLIGGRAIMERIAHLHRVQATCPDTWTTDSAVDAQELAALEVLTEQAEDACGDWKYELIRDSYFTEYFTVVLAGSGTLPKHMLLRTAAQRELTAQELKKDFRRLDFGGVPYWVLSI